MHQTTAEAQARWARKQKARSQLQRGGVLLASEAREAVRQKETRNAEAAAQKLRQQADAIEKADHKEKLARWRKWCTPLLHGKGAFRAAQHLEQGLKLHKDFRAKGIPVAGMAEGDEDDESSESDLPDIDVGAA